ncbi:TRAP transporter substrate-binding protein [Aquimarina sp. MMG015]|uniref:TRAP transporter substrate-binding protein n=1 Tax=Aquimarina TaxID=290174 RepID=UPI000402F454|nr:MULTISPECIES: TRAP transporter substrate-binding protein [Aquimarina]AXT57656.1 TRAP transporter substrate-binding protein [Aquimarina sp. AD1]MBQ4805804.1 TRAP transporter substrate-binding protein [Aquimarina sp. MMG015]RKN19392.1 TRAP transporter substrate-binding protein [Aquimarina sp. AD1]
MRIKILFPLFIGLLIIGSCSTKKEVKILRLAHTLDTKHPVHKAMIILGEKLKKKSNGTLQVKLYPSGQLGAERECLELLQIGSLDITKVSAAVLENFITEYKVFSIPYLFRDRQHAFQVFDGAIGDEMLTKGDKYRLRGLTFYDAGSRSFYTKEKPITTPEDLKGLKIRVQKSNMAVAMVNSLGGSPTPISWGELYTALQQGVVDGAENNLPSFYTSKHYEICKYFSLDQHTAVPDVLLIGLDTWERLSEQEQIWLKEAARESTIEQRKLWAASEKESLDIITTSGVEIITPDKTLFEQETESIQKMFQDNPDMLSLIKNIKNTKQ